jgi:tetratricopeptide (TPR) repeat protein
VELAQRLDEQWAQTLLDAGEKGEARKVLSDAANKWPKDAKLMSRRAKLETADGRQTEALPFAEAAHRAEPQSFTYEEAWIDAMTKAGKPADALAEFDQALKQFPDAPSSLYGKGINATLDLKQNDRFLQIAEAGLKAYPECTWLIDDVSLALHNLGRDDEALAMLEKALSVLTPGSWEAGNYRTYLEAINHSSGAAKTDHTLAEFRKRYSRSKPFGARPIRN